MKTLFLTNEFPPHIYGGAGVHVEYLSRELAKLIDVEVRCFGDQDSEKDDSLFKGIKTKGFSLAKDALTQTTEELKSPLGTLMRCVDFNLTDANADIVHCHTWYSHFGGILAKLLYGQKLVVTTHSLEPLRPWKREQIGRGYDLSSWIEKTAIEMADAVIAVSKETRADVMNHFNVDDEKLHVIPNGIDLNQYQKKNETGYLERYNIPTDLPYALFVGRITRQKGIIHLLRAAEHLDENIGLVLCAGAPDTEEIAQEMQELVDKLKKKRSHIYWIAEMVPKEAAIQLYSHAQVFCCPSIYEPFGIINLEAMACETPVVGSAVGGIKEIIIDEETGLLVPFEQQKQAPFEAVDPDRYAKDLATGINRIMKDDTLRESMAKAGRKRVEDYYSWTSIAKEVVKLYQSL